MIGRSDDACEREAERVAARIAAAPGGQPAELATAPITTGSAEVVQRTPDDDLSDGERPGEYLIQPSRVHDGAAPPPIVPDFASRLRALRRSGRALPEPVRDDMEAAIGEPFDDVRIHTGHEANALARSIHARAFAVGHDIAFAEGAYRPHERAGREVLAHELTHVVQQRGPRAGGAVAEAAPAQIQRIDFDLDIDLPTSIGDVVESLLRRYAPEIEPIVTQGPIGWLRDRLGGVFSGVVDTVAALDPGAFVDQLVETFSGMVTTAGEIVGALIAGDCAPLFDAMSRLKGFVTEVAGQAWDRLADFFRPVGDFFSDLWESVTSVGSAAIDWIKRFAGDVWSTIESIGEFIWDKTQPIRDYGLGAWDWVKEQLFGPAENESQGDSRGGIIGWFSDKASEAWTWVQDQTRPVWEPISEAVETVRELIPPAFVAELGESMTRLSDDLNTTVDEMEGGASVAENREALAGILPSVEDVIAAIRNTIVFAGTWLTTTLTAVSTRVTTFMTRLRANSLVAILAGHLAWLETAVARLTSWAADHVGGLFAWLLQAFDFLTPFVQRIAAVVGQVISLVGDLLKLPQLILTAAWELIPECIREPIKDFIINQILGRIPVFKQFAAIGQLWSRLQETALKILRALFVDGDIAKAAYTYFSALLSLIGLPARLVASILTKAVSALGLILQDPIGFLVNTLKALKEGFTLFFANTLEHLIGGITGWLFGHVREAGLEPPREFSLKGVLGFVMQLLDLTVERVLERLALKIGRDKVTKIQRFLEMATGVWRFVSVVINEGVAGLWQFLKDQLSNLWDLVLDSVIGWVTQKIITDVTIKILSMLDPSGIMAVIQSAIAIYRAIESFIEQLRAMLEIVSRVLDGVAGIARGAIGQAAEFLEGALARSLPIAIAFLANQVGLGGLSNRIREFVEGVRERINGAIDWLIEQGIRLGQGFLALLERGVGVVKGAIGAIRDWWRARTSFRNAAGEEHSIYIEGSGRNARVMIRSTPQTYADFISAVDVGEDPAKRAAKQTALGTARELDGAIVTAAASQPAAVPGADSEDQAAADNHATIIQGLLDRLGIETAVFMPQSVTDASGQPVPSSNPVYGSLVNSYGSSASVLRLTQRVPPGGGPPSIENLPSWQALRRRGGKNSTYYVRGHLLNDNLGGPGNSWSNLTPLTQEANNRSKESHLHGFEAQVKKAVLESSPPRAVNFVCVANYGRGGRESQAADFETLRSPAALDLGAQKSRLVAAIIREEAKVPLSVDCSAHEIDADGRPKQKIWEFPVDNRIKTADEDYDIFEGAADAKDVLQVNELSDDEVNDWMQAVPGIGPATVARFTKERRAKCCDGRKRRPFGGRADLVEKPGGEGRSAALTEGKLALLEATYDIGFKSAAADLCTDASCTDEAEA